MVMVLMRARGEHEPSKTSGSAENRMMCLFTGRFCSILLSRKMTVIHQRGVKWRQQEMQDDGCCSSMGRM